MPQLLLIEDDPIMGESLLDRFELEGFGVRWSRTIRQASALLEEAAFDAVVSDVRLPDGSGEQLFESRLHTAASLPPWLFITAFASVDRAVAMLQAGACDYVTKPFDIAELVSKVRGAIGSHEDGLLFAGERAEDSVLGPSGRHARSHRRHHG